MHINQSITESSRLDGDPWPCFGSVSTKRGLPARRHPSARQYEPYQCEVAAVIGMEGAFAKGIFSEVERMERVTVFQWPAYHNLVTIDIAALLWRHYPTSAKPHEGLKFSLAWPHGLLPPFCRGTSSEAVCDDWQVFVGWEKHDLRTRNNPCMQPGWIKVAYPSYCPMLSFCFIPPLGFCSIAMLLRNHTTACCSCCGCQDLLQLCHHGRTATFVLPAMEFQEVSFLFVCSPFLWSEFHFQSKHTISQHIASTIWSPEVQ